MAVRKPRPADTPNMRAIAHRVAVARRAIPRRDFAPVQQLARELGLDIDYAMDEFDDRATALEWVDGLDRETADAKALEQMREAYGRLG